MDTPQKLYATPALQEYREKNDLSQREIAEIITVTTGKKMSFSLYQKYESGEKPVPLNRALAITKALKLGFSELWVGR